MEAVFPVVSAWEDEGVEGVLVAGFFEFFYAFEVEEVVGLVVLGDLVDCSCYGVGFIEDGPFGCYGGVIGVVFFELEVLLEFGEGAGCCVFCVLFYCFVELGA